MAKSYIDKKKTNKKIPTRRRMNAAQSRSRTSKEEPTRRPSKEDTKEEKKDLSLRRTKSTAQPTTDDDTTTTQTLTPKKSQTSKTKTRRPAGDTVSPEVDAALQDFVNHHINTDRIKEEFEELQKVLPEEGEHRRCCQEKSRRRGETVCLDATRIILQTEDENQTDFIHANRIKLEGVEREYILSQTPMPNTVEDFWRMVFQEQSTCVIVASTHYEEGKQSSPCFWPMDVGTYQYYGPMFVNNKKVDTGSQTTAYTIEVLPNGCSNSLMTTVYHYTTWPNSSYITSHKTLIQLRSQMKAGEKGPLTIVSTEGIGRSAMFVVIDATLTRLFKGMKTRLLDVATQLRKQRAESLHFPMTYYFSVQVILNYIKNKVKKYESEVQQFGRQLAEQLKSKMEKTEDGGGETRGSKD